MSIEQLKTAMVKFEASRVACEQHAGYVQAELQALQAGVLKHTMPVVELNAATRMATVRKRRRLSALSVLSVPGQGEDSEAGAEGEKATGVGEGVGEGEAEAAAHQASLHEFDEAVLDAEGRVQVAQRALARVHGAATQLRRGVDTAAGRAEPLLGHMPLAAAREAANCTCSPLIEILGRADITAVAGGAAARPRAVLGELSVVQLWRLRRVCRAFRRWVTEQLQSLPPLVVLAGATKKQSCMNNPNKTVGPTGWECLSSVEILDFTTMLWTSGADSDSSGGGAQAGGPVPPPPLASPLAWHVSCRLTGGSLVVAGGITSFGPPEKRRTAAACCWRPGQDCWAELPTLLVIGGFGKRADESNVATDLGWLPTVEALRVDSSGWDEMAQLAEPRCYAAAGCLPNGHVIVAGGRCENGNDGIVATAELYDPIANKWTPLPPMAHPRRCAAGCMLPSGKFAVIGGKDNRGQRRADAECFDPGTGQWSLLPNPTYNRSEGAAATVPGGLIVAGYVDTPVEFYDEEKGLWIDLPHIMSAKRQAMSLVSI